METTQEHKFLQTKETALWTKLFQEQLIGRLPIATQGMFPETITITITRYQVFVSET